MYGSDSCECPIWGTQATRLSELGDYAVYDSPRAGGRYKLTGSAEAILNANKGKREYHAIRRGITNEIYLSSLLGQVPLVDAESLAHVRYSPLRVDQKYNRFVQAAGRSFGGMGESFSISAFWWEDTGHYFAAVIDGESLDRGEYARATDWLSGAAVERGHFKLDRSNLGVGAISVEGWKYIEALGLSQNLSDQIFVAMWFGNTELRVLYDEHMKPAIEGAGYNSVRIDDTHHNEKIDDQILAEIRKSRAVIVDMTCGLAVPDGWSKSPQVGAPRGGVFFEAGFARGLNLPVIWTVKSDIADVENVVHFDVRQFNQIRWSAVFGDFSERLRNRIEATLGRGDART